MQQRALTEFFGARPGVGGGGGADGGGGGDARVADGSDTMRAMYTPNVTGRNHYAIRKKDYNPTEAEAKAFFNITEVVGTFLTVGRRVTGNTFTRMASHRIVAPTRQQSQRQAMVRKYRAVATHHKAKVPPLEQLIAYRRPDKKLASYFSITGQLSYFCHMVLGREVTYGDLGYIVHPLSQTERELLGAREHDTVVSAYVEWCQQARTREARSAGVIAKYIDSGKKTRTGRDGREEVLVVANRYSGSTVFNRAKAWQLVVAAYANQIGVQLEDLQQQRQQQQRLRGSTDIELEAALAEANEQYGYATMRLNAAAHIVRAADGQKKMEQRERSSLAAKVEAQRYVPHAKLVEGVEKWRQALNLSARPWFAQRVQELGEWLLVALTVFVPPLRREMYMKMDVHDVKWDTELDTWCIMMTHFFKTAQTAVIDRVLLVETLVEPMATYLRHRHVLNQRVGTDPRLAAEANRALFVNSQQRRHSGTSMSGVFRHFGGRYLGLASFGPHICRDIRLG